MGSTPALGELVASVPRRGNEAEQRAVRPRGGAKHDERRAAAEHQVDRLGAEREQEARWQPGRPRYDGVAEVRGERQHPPGADIEERGDSVESPCAGEGGQVHHLAR